MNEPESGSLPPDDSPQESAEDAMSDERRRSVYGNVFGSAGIADLLPKFDFAKIASLDKIRLGIGAQAVEQLQVAMSMIPITDLRKLAGAQGWGQFAGRTLSRSSDFEHASVDASPYSTEMTGPADYFARHEVVIDSFDSLHNEISNITTRASGLRLVWRGVRDASWGLHSNLFRRLMDLNGVVHPSSKPASEQPYPDEDQMVRAEAKLLNEARSRWRLDGTSALEMFAKLQHFGAPTRLIDVSRNPYIAAWFAVEFSDPTESEEARLFALATAPIGESTDPRYAEIVMDKAGSSYQPFWHHMSSNPERQEFDWGTGARRRIWFPPAYDPRIVAQNAGFVIDGVPMTSSRTAPYFKKSTTASSYWNRSDLLASASIYAKTAHPHQAFRANRANLAPVFTFRITCDAKLEIRRHLEQFFDYTAATIYPDVAKLSEHLNHNFDEVVSE